MSRLGKIISVLILTAAAAVLIVSLLQYRQIRKNQEENRDIIRAQNEEILAQLTELLPETSDGTVSRNQHIDDELYMQQSSSYEQDTEQEGRFSETDAEGLRMLEIQGISCVGMLEIPVRHLAWAVADISSDTDDCYLPAVVSGDPESGSLLIRGFNSQAQFGQLEDISLGNEVTFTDVNGVQYAYEVVGTARISLAQVEKTLDGEMTGLIVSSEAMAQTNEIDLQLYYDMNGRYRFVVDCRAVSA